MNKAKETVSHFLSKEGKHDTTVHEKVAPAVQNETVNRTQHENVQKAVDREVHQDHYHTSVQPIAHREVLPEQHHHSMAPVEHREIHHGNDSHVKDRLASEAAQFKNTQTVSSDVTHTSTAAPTVEGVHQHHHIHEKIQPVINKETVQPHVVHQTIPIHETHHNEAKHHTSTALPAMSMSEFKNSGGVLGGREERTDAFAGEPNAIGRAADGHGASGASMGTHSGTGVGAGTGSHTGTAGTGSMGTHTGTGTQHGTTGTTTKPSLMDKLNPMKDTDRDGKKGIMD